MTRYEQGFMSKCAEAGLPPLRAAQLYSMRKQALSNAAIAGLGAGGGALLGAGAGALIPAGDGDDRRKKRIRNMLIGALLGGGIGGGVGYGLGKNMDAGIAKRIREKGTGAGFDPSDNMEKTIGQARRTGAIDRATGLRLLQRQIYINQAVADARVPGKKLTPEELATIRLDAGKKWDTLNGAIDFDKKMNDNSKPEASPAPTAKPSSPSQGFVPRGWDPRMGR